MKTVRLTMAQALVRYLCVQNTEIDGRSEPLFAGVFGIFGHGNVTCLAEALEAVQDRLPTWRGQNEQSMALAAVAFAKARQRRQMMACTSSIGPGATNMVTAAAVAHAFPNTAIVLNHTGFPWDRSEEGLRAWRRGMETLAREPNVHVKVSEFGLKDREWEYESNRRVVLDALAIFGVERAMFATNFPVAGLRIGYGALVQAMSRMLAHLSPEQCDRFFWKNAKAFYRL